MSGIALTGDARAEIGWGLGSEGLAAQAFPALQHMGRISLQQIRRGACGGGAQHDAAFHEPADMVGQTLAFGLAVDAAREADARPQRMVDDVAARHGEIHGEPWPLLAVAFVAHLHQHGRAGRRPVVQAGAIHGAQEARAADADIDKSRIELGHHPFQPPKEDAVDEAGPITAHDLQFDQAAFGGQRHQERLGHDVANQAIDAAHADLKSATVSNSGKPTTLL